MFCPVSEPRHPCLGVQILWYEPVCRGIKICIIEPIVKHDCKWNSFIALEKALSRWNWGKDATKESSLVESNWLLPKIVCLASLYSRGRDSAQSGSTNFRAILIFRMKSSAVDWIDGESFHLIPPYGTGSHSSDFSLGFNCWEFWAF